MIKGVCFFPYFSACNVFTNIFSNIILFAIEGEVLLQNLHPVLEFGDVRLIIWIIISLDL
jgi:hypothetical protein